MKYHAIVQKDYSQLTLQSDVHAKAGNSIPMYQSIKNYIESISRKIYSVSEKKSVK